MEVAYCRSIFFVTREIQSFIITSYFISRAIKGNDEQVAFRAPATFLLDKEMNIFILATLPLDAARLHCDKHVVKMILECTQLLYTSFHLWGVDVQSACSIAPRPYAATHRHHPCALWTAGCQAHFKWVLELAFALCERYTFIYNKRHACVDHLVNLSQNTLDHMPSHIDPDAWLLWIRDTLSSPNHETIRYGTRSPPNGCTFGVLCINDTSVDPDGDVVATYHNYYAHKALVDNVRMRWNKQDFVPSDLQTAILSTQARLGTVVAQIDR